MRGGRRGQWGEYGKNKLYIIRKPISVYVISMPTEKKVKGVSYGKTWQSGWLCNMPSKDEPRGTMWLEADGQVDNWHKKEAEANTCTMATASILGFI